MLEVAITSLKCALRDDYPEFKEFYDERGWEPKEIQIENAPAEVTEEAQNDIAEVTEEAQNDIAEVTEEAQNDIAEASDESTATDENDD